MLLKAAIRPMTNNGFKRINPLESRQSFYQILWTVATRLQIDSQNKKNHITGKLPAAAATEIIVFKRKMLFKNKLLLNIKRNLLHVPD